MKGGGVILYVAGTCYPRKQGACGAMLLFGALAIFGIAGCGTGANSQKEAVMATKLDSRVFGTHDGQPVNLYTLANSKGFEAAITKYGGIVTSLRVADRRGEIA